MNINEFKRVFDKQLKQYITSKIQQSQILLNTPDLNKYIEYIDTFVFSGGKRIRPYCAWLMYRWFWGTNEEAISEYSIAFEILHTMALVHDDIIDQAQKRHNVDTVHTYIHKQLKENNFQVAQSQAILIGDLLLARVYEIMYKDYDFEQIFLHDARRNVHAMIEEVILGQMIDVQMMSGITATKEMIEKKNMFKTASYTFTRPLVTWAMLAGASKSQQKLVANLGNALWQAFQIKDDLMDIMLGDTTKSLFSDIQEWQQTYFTQYIRDHWSAQDNQLLDSCMGKILDHDQIAALQTMFTETKAIETWIDQMHEYTKKAKDLLNKIEFVDTLAYQWIIDLILKIEKIW